MFDVREVRSPASRLLPTVAAGVGDPGYREVAEGIHQKKAGSPFGGPAVLREGSNHITGREARGSALGCDDVGLTEPD
jgi:hypothetical protein